MSALGEGLFAPYTNIIAGIFTDRKKYFLVANKSASIIAVAALILLGAYVLAFGEPFVSLIQPGSGIVFNTTNNITFECNATDDASVARLDLYYSKAGEVFSQKNTSCFGELCADSSTMLLLHFNNNSAVGENNTYAYDWSGNGNNATIAGAAFNATGGKFGGAFKFDGTSSNYIKISDSNSVDLDAFGSIEFWIFAMQISGDEYVLTKQSSDCQQAAYEIILTSSGNIELDLGPYGDIYTYIHPTTLQINRWYYVAATWNTTEVIIYVNDLPYYGVSGGLNPAPNFIKNTHPLWIGTTSNACNILGPYFNGKIDEFALYNRMLTPKEIGEHYNRSLVNNATKSWNITNVSDGTYSWNCRASDNETQIGWAAANRTFFVDMVTPPSVNAITLSPNSPDDIDPGVTINVTANITDRSGVDTVILKYTNPVPTTVPVTMSYNSTTKLYYASFTPTAEGIWKYRVWANDSHGSAGENNNTSVLVESDRTWTVSVINKSGQSDSTLGTTYAYRGTTNNKMGTIILNNTGDLALSFNLTASPAIITYNVSVPFLLTSKEIKEIEVRGDAPDVLSEYPVTITISSTGASPAQRTANGSLVSFVGGPYLVVSIEGYAQNAEQNQTINLSARVKNIGNESASGVWLNWTLPTGWTNTTGNLSKYIGAIENDTSGWNYIQAYINPALASPGFFEIHANSTPEGNKTDQHSKTIFISCSNSDNVCGIGCSYASDDDCPPPAGGPGAPGGSTGTSATVNSQEIKYKLSLQAPERVDAYRGEKANIAITATNSEPGRGIDNVSVYVLGYPAAHITVVPQKVPRLAPMEAKIFRAEIYVPTYMKYGPNMLTVRAIGYESGKSTENDTVEASLQMSFVVHSATENETLSLVENATELLAEMERMNLGATKTAELVFEAKRLILLWDYDSAKALAEKAVESGKTAIRGRKTLDLVEQILSGADKYGIEARDTRKMYSLASAAFEREDFARAEERANSALLAASIEAEGKVRTLNFLEAYWKLMILASIAAAYAGAIAYKKAVGYIIKKEIARLEVEAKVIRGLVLDAKRDYFEKRASTKSDYRKAVYEYDARLSGIKKERIALTLKMASVMNPEKVVRFLESDKKRIEKAIEDVQRGYFEDRSVNKANYHNSMHELRAELAEINLGISIAREKAGNNKPRAKEAALSAVIAIALFAAGLSAAYVSSQASASAAITGADAQIKDMQAMGLKNSFANDTLNEARLLYSKGDYSAAEATANYVGTLKNTAVRIESMIDDAEAKAYDASVEGFDVSEARMQIAAGIKAFQDEDYSASEQLMNGAIAKIDEMLSRAAMEGARKSSGTAWAAEMVKKNKGTVAAAAAGLFFAGMIWWKLEKSRRRKKRLERLDAEAAAAQKMIRELQKKYFQDGAISKSEYSSGVKRYMEISIHSKKEKAILLARKKPAKPAKN